MEENKIKLSKKDVWKAFLKWTFFSHSNYNYERLQASGILQSMSHIPEKLYPGNKEEQKKFMQRHMSFYNTEPHFGGIINGMVLAMEEERANGADIDDDAINNIKTGLMGPMAGIGDTLWQGTLQPIALAVGISIIGWKCYWCISICIDHGSSHVSNCLFYVYERIYNR